MTIVEPIPDVQYGKANWTDYVSNWRQKDASYIQERSILRYATAAARSAAGEWPTPRPGQVTYRADADRLEMYSSLRSAWVGVLLFQYLTSPVDTAAGVNLSHTSAAGKGLTLTPTNAVLDLPVDMYNGLLTAAATGVGVQTTAQKKALLTTNATELVSDTPLAFPGLRLTGAGTIDATGKAVTVGALTAVSAIIPNITLSGTLSGGVINGTSGTIGSVAHASGRVTASDGALFNGGRFYGQGSNAMMQANGGSPYIQIDTGGARYAGGGQFDFHNTMRMLNNSAIVYYYNGNSQAANIAPSLYSGGDPGAGNFPEGTIWIN